MLPWHYIINLDRAKGRWAHMQKEMHALPYVRVKGVDGAALSSAAIAAASTRLCATFCSRGMIGCYLSHLETWKKVARSPAPYAVICEDDIYLTPDYRQKLGALCALKDLDFVYLGCIAACGKRDTAGKGIEWLVKATGAQLGGGLPPSPLLEVPTYPLGLHCYLLSRSYAQYLVDTMARVNYHVDTALLSVHRGAVYALRDPIAYQRSSNANSMQKSSTFPALLDKYWDRGEGITWGYYFGVPLASLGPMYINGYTVILSVLTVLCPRQALPLWALYLCLELCLAPDWLVPLLLVFISCKLLS